MSKDLWDCQDCGSTEEPILATDENPQHTCKNCGSHKVAWFRETDD